METRTVADLRILLPDFDPRDLDEVTEVPDDDVVEAKVEDADWSGVQLAGGRIRLSHLVAVNLAESEWRTGGFYGCRFERVDLSGARLSRATVERCEFIGCRMTGLQLNETTLKNVVFEDCRLDYAAFGEVRATGPVAWTGCNLDRAAWTDCRLPSVAVRSCSLRGLELRDCDLRGADLRDNDLSAITGLSSLRGVRLTQDQLGDLAAIAAQELQIDVAG